MCRSWTKRLWATLAPCDSNSKNIVATRFAPRAIAGWMCSASVLKTTTPSASGAA
jgi:hypothetical protein